VQAVPPPQLVPGLRTLLLYLLHQLARLPGILREPGAPGGRREPVLADRPGEAAGARRRADQEVGRSEAAHPADEPRHEPDRSQLNVNRL